jgi:hypothetical protein
MDRTLQIRKRNTTQGQVVFLLAGQFPAMKKNDSWLKMITL